MRRVCVFVQLREFPRHRIISNPFINVAAFPTSSCKVLRVGASEEVVAPSASVRFVCKFWLEVGFAIPLTMTFSTVYQQIVSHVFLAVHVYTIDLV